MGDHVTAFARSRRLSRCELAAAVGMKERRLARLLSGKTKLLAADVEAFAKAISKPVGVLFRDRRHA